MDNQNQPWAILEPIEQRTATEMVADRLIKLFANGDLKPGDKLPPERELAHQLQVGRTTVREALKLLTLSGLLEAKRGDGTYVNLEFTNFISRQIEWPVLLSGGEVDMIVEVREALELKAARLAAERATPKEVEEIAIYKQLGDSKKRDFRHETDVDLQFHNAIAVASHNRLLLLVMASLREILRKYIYLSNEKTSSNQTTLSEHEAIYKAIAAHDPEAADKSMHHHLEVSKAEILKTIGQNSAEAKE
jgi:GntR family transcriptional repressor for pyruvate dehydrogenase complex